MPSSQGSSASRVRYSPKCSLHPMSDTSHPRPRYMQSNQGLNHLKKPLTTRSNKMRTSSSLKVVLVQKTLTLKAPQTNFAAQSMKKMRSAESNVSSSKASNLSTTKIRKLSWTSNVRRRNYLSRFVNVARLSKSTSSSKRRHSGVNSTESTGCVCSCLEGTS